MTHVLGLDGITDKLIRELEYLKIPLIEDVCESHGAAHNNSKLGTFGWASNFSFYYAHHLTTIEGGMICTDDVNLYELLRVLRAHGMAREASLESTRKKFIDENPSLNKDFIFTVASHNMRPNEINGILGLSQLKRLDKTVVARRNNFSRFLSKLNKEKFHTDFVLEGNSNYAFILILKEQNFETRDKIEENLIRNGIEFRRGLSGGGNQLRQPFIKEYIDNIDLSQFPNVEHIHFNSWYIGNYPELDLKQIDLLLDILNKI